jgi:hypothetical protein
VGHPKGAGRGPAPGTNNGRCRHHPGLLHRRFKRCYCGRDNDAGPGTGSNIVGITFPFLLTRFGLDPSVASSPFITIVDAIGLLIYFSVASLVLL